jgi:hypothetical protein
MVGSGKFNWPTDTALRVSTQVALLRAIASGDVKLLDLAIGFCYASSNRVSDHYWEFSKRVLRPFLRDLADLADRRISPPVLAESLAMPLPETGDSTLDQLVQAAREGFSDKSPAARKLALEKLWDAWERLKSLNDIGNKRLSVAQLLDQAATEPAFRTLLENEATALTGIGNSFHIRHFETDRAPVTTDAHVDYLFHRMWALLWLLLTSR